jgi:peptidoglycan/LPS O-acetylase OafA/YrhL
LYPSIPVYTGFLTAVAITLVLAVGSWHFIEYPANRFAKNLANNKARAQYHIALLHKLIFIQIIFHPLLHDL